MVSTAVKLRCLRTVCSYRVPDDLGGLTTVQDGGAPGDEVWGGTWVLSGCGKVYGVDWGEYFLGRKLLLYGRSKASSWTPSSSIPQFRPSTTKLRSTARSRADWPSLRLLSTLIVLQIQQFTTFPSIFVTIRTCLCSFSLGQTPYVVTLGLYYHTLGLSFSSGFRMSFCLVSLPYAEFLRPRIDQIRSALELRNVKPRARRAQSPPDKIRPRNETAEKDTFSQRQKGRQANL